MAVHVQTGTAGGVPFWERAWVSTGSAVNLSVTNQQSPPARFAVTTSSTAPTSSDAQHPFPNFLQTGPLPMQLTAAEHLWVFANPGTRTEMTEG